MRQDVACVLQWKKSIREDTAITIYCLAGSIGLA